MLVAGQVVQNRYRIVALLKQGDMGTVYQAWDILLNVPVALKEMIPQPGLDSCALAQLRQQTQDLGQVPFHIRDKGIEIRDRDSEVLAVVHEHL